MEYDHIVVCFDMKAHLAVFTGFNKFNLPGVVPIAAVLGYTVV